MKSVPRKQTLGPTRAGERPSDERVRHRLQLARRSWKKHDEAVPDLHHLSGRSAVGIVENDAALNDQRLTAIHVGHREAAPRKPLAESLDNLRILDERHTQHVSQRIARNIVVGRPEAAGQDHEVDAVEGAAQVLGYLTAVVPDDGLRSQLDAEGSEPLGKEERVRVEARRAQQLAPDRKDLGRSERQRGAVMRAIPERAVISRRSARWRRRRHRVVGHHAQAAVQRFQPTRGIGFDDVENAEEEESRERAGRPRE